jgi:hypothetical protein
MEGTDEKIKNKHLNKIKCWCPILLLKSSTKIFINIDFLTTTNNKDVRRAYG